MTGDARQETKRIWTRWAYRVLISAAAAAIPLSSAASAQNLLQNPGFDSNLAGWSVDIGFSEAVWSNLDHTGRQDSGSALVTGMPSNIPLTFSYATLKQCVPVLPGHSYSFGASLRADFPEVFPAALAFAMSVAWDMDTVCMGPGVAAGFLSPLPVIGSTWIDIQANMTAPAGSASALLTIQAMPVNPAAQPRIYIDDAYFEVDVACVPTASSLCLAQNRFRVFGSWSVPPDNRHGYMRAEPLTSESGVFWFFEPQNPEIVLKVLNACVDPFQRYWVFAAGLTNVETSFWVQDTVSDEIRQYSNPFGTAFTPIQDTAAFATCP